MIMLYLLRLVCIGGRCNLIAVRSIHRIARCLRESPKLTRMPPRYEEAPRTGIAICASHHKTKADFRRSTRTLSKHSLRTG